MIHRCIHVGHGFVTSGWPLKLSIILSYIHTDRPFFFPSYMGNLIVEECQDLRHV